MPTLTRRNILIAILMLLAVALAFAPSAAHAQGPKPGDKIIFGGSFTLSQGQSLDGGLVVFGGVANIEANALVNGDVAVIGGTATINGQINGDVVALGGAVTLGPSAEVNGDATAIGGIINRDPGAKISGNIVETNSQEEINGIGKIGPGGIQITPKTPGQWNGEFGNFPFQRDHRGPFGWLLRMFLGGMSAIAWTAVMVALGVFMVLLAPRPTERVANAMRHNILLAFAVGLAAVLLAMPVIFVLAITICLIPVAIVIPFALLIAWLFGWLSLGWLIGKEMLKSATTTNATPIWEVIVGVAILTLLWRLPYILPFVGGFAAFLVLFVAGNIAIGGALLTRFGFRDYPTASSQSAAPPPPPERALPPESTAPAESKAEEPEHPIIPPPPPPTD